MTTPTPQTREPKFCQDCIGPGVIVCGDCLQCDTHCEETGCQLQGNIRVRLSELEAENARLRAEVGHWQESKRIASERAESAEATARQAVQDYTAATLALKTRTEERDRFNAEADKYDKARMMMELELRKKITENAALAEKVRVLRELGDWTYQTAKFAGWIEGIRRWKEALSATATKGEGGGV